jgi:DNA (cytosine-5)-methyltransferase 1
LNYIELFAGCGGLSLGLKSAGFELIFANELSPMAAETYSLNFLNEDLESLSKSKSKKPQRTLWLSSNYQKSDLKFRLREDPRTFPSIGHGFTDISKNISDLEGSLLVGSIVDLNVLLDQEPELLNSIRITPNRTGVDLVSGGPPCQSFSMAGLRRKDCEKNSLPWEFVKFVQSIKPRIALLENVTGILRPFKDESGKKYYAWFEIAKAFAQIGYIPLCLHVNAKFAGVPQNRPRFILIAVREDFYESITHTFNDPEITLFSKSVEFFYRTKKDTDLSVDSLNYHDLVRANDRALFENSFLSPLVSRTERWTSVSDAIDDLRKNNTNSPFARMLSTTFGQTLKQRPLSNHVLRANSSLVKRRFRIYQVLQLLDSPAQKSIQSALKGESSLISDHAWEQISHHDFLDESGQFEFFQSKNEFSLFLSRHQTKKQTQKALVAEMPAPAALSIPDDACHYHHDELRTLTVREMARIQSFPDSFEFRSKTTTGGKMRQFEVPQYTQVGNAVPPVLARALAESIADLLSRAR